MMVVTCLPGAVAGMRPMAQLRTDSMTRGEEYTDTLYSQYSVLRAEYRGYSEPLITLWNILTFMGLPIQA